MQKVVIHAATAIIVLLLLNLFTLYGLTNEASGQVIQMIRVLVEIDPDRIPEGAAQVTRDSENIRIWLPGILLLSVLWFTLYTTWLISSLMRSNRLKENNR